MNTVSYADFVKSNAPYPEIRVIGKNKYYADLLREDYVGLVSETTAVAQYIYHHYDIKKIDPEMAEMLKEVAIVEMEHLDILAQVIVLLGERPIYYAEDTFWSANYVDYGYDILYQLESDLDSEYRAIVNYNRHIEMIDDPYIKDILRRIVLDEEAHVQFFKMAMEKIRNERKKM